MSASLALPRPRASLWIAGAAALLLVALFHDEATSAIAIWNSSTAYGHCWLILPIAGWLLWERRAVLAALSPQPIFWPALLAPPVAMFWIAADWLGIMEGRQLAVIGFVELLLLAALGLRLWWALSPAFLYLFFLVPFGAFVTPLLQRFTAHFIVAGLGLTTIPFSADAMRITIPEGTFYVAEACAGLRFLIASMAFGVLYALTMFRSPGRRAAFIAAACVVPVIANGFRGLGIVLLGHALGSAEAATADHVIYGWVFFSAVIFALAMAGLPFREMPAPPPRGVASQPDPGVAVALTCAPILAIAFAAQLAAAGATTAPAGTALPDLATPAGCTRPAPDRFTCGGFVIDIRATRLPPGSNPAQILQAARQPALASLGGELDSSVWQGAWGIAVDRNSGEAAAYSVLALGSHMTGSLHDRLRLVRAMLEHDSAPVLALSAHISPGAPEAADMLRGFLSAQK